MIDDIIILSNEIIVKLINGKVSIDQLELNSLREFGFTVDMHTLSYANGIYVTLPDLTQIGFYNWLFGLDCYIGDQEIHIKDEQHMCAVLDLMHSVVNLNKFKV